ncbi:MAG: MBL fold metallo-hydrolase [Clostridia bacterium]|nr:MBL fold metallo-hydrolase [Clostridia bacterium]
MSRKKKLKKLKLFIVELILFIIIACVCKICFGLEINQLDDVKAFFYSNLNNAVDVFSVENETNTKLNTSGEELQIYYFDVGQADSILLINNNETMLIDAGNNEDGNNLVKYIKSLGVTKLNYVIGTHAHEDHIGGMDNIIREFDVENVMLSPVTSNSKTYEGVLNEIENKKLKITVPEIGDTFKVGNTTSKVLSVSNDEEECNNSSIVVRTEFYNNSFLFMADLESNYEKKVTWPQTTVVKIGHHGASTSSCEDFLNQTKPEYSIISVGKDNSYNHPSSSTLKRLRKINSEIHRTDEQGTILLTSNGTDINFDFYDTDIDT